MKGIQRWDLKCKAVSLTYDFFRHAGQLRMDEGNCCDMRGCIELFERIDPEVRTIYTFAGDEPDTIYKREGKEWHAFMPRVVKMS